MVGVVSRGVRSLAVPGFIEGSLYTSVNQRLTSGVTFSVQYKELNLGSHA